MDKAIFKCVGIMTLCLSVSPLVGQPIATTPMRGESESRSEADGVQGLWVWRECTVADPVEQDRLIDFCRRYGFNLLLVQVHQVEGADVPTLRFPDQLARLIEVAADNGIAVEALDGAPDMAQEQNQERTLAILDAILRFNQTLPDDRRLVGIHYDIEPYLLPQWQDNAHRQKIMSDYLSFLGRAKQKLADQAPEMTLAADIPFWYDRLTDPNNHVMVLHNGFEKNLHQHIQDLCDYIGIMSYRRQALGPNSVVEHVANELDYAEQIGKFVCPALETGELPETPEITFYGAPSEEFHEQQRLVRRSLSDRPGFGGMLIHSYASLRPLLDQTTPVKTDTSP